MFALPIDMQLSTADQDFQKFVINVRAPVSWVCNNNNSNSASGLFDTSNIADSLRDKRTYYIADEISLLHKKYTENPDVIKYGSENALRVMKNSKLVIDAAKKTFGIDISCNVSPKSNNLVKDILCITHALRNIETDDIMFAKPAEDELDFFYAFSNKRVMKLQSSFPRQQDDEVIVSFYKMGDLLYMNNMPLKSLVNDLENYL